MTPKDTPAQVQVGWLVETAYGATEFGWTDWRDLQDGDKRLKALVVSLFGNEHQAFADLEALIDRASHGQAPAAAPAQAIGPCVICGSDEPFTGTCGSGDPRALCKQPAPQPLPASQGDALSQAASDVLAERQRQISAEGWTQSHDDLEHEPGQLSSAAACYALNASEWLTRPYVSRADYATLSFIDLSNWPWDGSWWKPKNERGDLVRAGALIIAELERMDRADAARAAQEGK